MNHIPGFFEGNHQKEIIKLLYRYNSPYCVGVEIGCLHGRSSYAISLAINKGKLYCIDLWGNEEVYYEENNKKISNSLEIFLEYTKNRNNIIPIRGSSPSIVKDWEQPVDFVFLDASHVNPNDRDNIDFWLSKIKPGGIFLGHDWQEGAKPGKGCPDVNLNVEYMEDLLKQKVTIIPETSIWYFTMSKN